MYNGNYRVTIPLSRTSHKRSDYMTEATGYNTYVAKNGTELNFPKVSKNEMTGEQRMFYQSFINVLAHMYWSRPDCM